MPDLEISNLPELTGAALAATDPLAVADLSASETKRITAKDLVQSGLGLVDDASIPAAKVAALGATQLASDSVTTAKIVDSAVSTAKIADAGVTDAKLATGLSGAKLSDASVTAAKLGTVTDRGLDQVGGSVGHTNSLTAGTASGISFDAQGHVTATTTIPAADLPVATTTAIGGVSVPSGSGLTVSGSGALDHESSIAAGSTANIVYDEHGHITTIEALTGDHLPVATTVEKGAVSVPVGGKLEVTATGVLSLSNTAVTPGVHTKVTVDAQGRVTSGSGLDAADIPDLNVNKLTTGQLVTTQIADDAVTAAKLADRSTATIAQITPSSGAFIGQAHFNSITGDYYLWDGNVWQPIGISVGEIVLAGTYNATTNLVATVTGEGAALGFTVGSALPAAVSANKGYYVVVSTAGTGTAPAPVVTLNPPDFLLSTGSLYTEIDVSSTVTAQQAANIAFTPSGTLASANVQSAIEELDTEKVTSANPTLTGTVTLDTAATLAFEGATANAFETTLTVVDPTADRTITLPDASGSVITTGDTGTVTSAMILNATIVNDDVNASAAIADTKLGTISTGGKVSNSATTATAVNTASAIVARDGSGNFAAGTVTAALSGNAATSTALSSARNFAVTGDVTGTVSSDLTSGASIATSIASGVIVNADVNASAAIAGTKISPDFGSQAVTTTGLISADGKVSFPLGTAALPSLYPGSDTNTGIYSPGADQLAISTNGVGRLFVAADGNVGIGTSSPQTKLHVSAGTDNEALRVQSGRHTFRFDNVKTGTGTDWNAYQQVLEHGVDTTTQEFIKFGTGNDNSTTRINLGTQNEADLMHLVTDKVGIGTSAPGAKLHVESAATTAGWQLLTNSVGLSNESGFYRDSSDNYELVIRNGLGGLSFIKNDGGASTANLVVNVQGSERVRIASAGQIGLGGANYGTAGQVITSNGSGSAPTWQDAGGGGGGAWNLLSTITASGASTVDFTSNIDSTYRTYVITGSEVVASTDTDLNLRFYDNGTLNTSSEYDYSHVRLEGTVLNDAQDNGVGQVNLTHGSNAGIGRGANMVEIVIDNPSASKTQYKGRYTVVADEGSDLSRFMGVLAMDKGSAYTNVDGVRLYPASGTISGTFKLYGIS